MEHETPIWPRRSNTTATRCPGTGTAHGASEGTCHDAASRSRSGNPGNFPYAHFYSTPYYVYQYATCLASSAELLRQLRGGPSEDRAKAIDPYLTLLKSGGSDHPMPLHQRAGMDRSRPETVRAVVHQLDTLVTQLEHEIHAIS